jgi:hypothetical protein
MNPNGWIEQAKLAERGEWKAFEKLQGELQGGRKKENNASRFFGRHFRL